MADIGGENLIGSNVVYDTRQPVNYFLRNIDKQNAQRAAEQKALQDEMSKIKIDGVREPDRNEYISKYNEWKDSFRSMTGAKDPAAKAQKKLEFDKKQLELQELVADSKALNKGETEFSKILLGSARDNYSDDAVSKYQNSLKLPRTDPNYLRDLTKYERVVDTSKVNDKLNALDTYLLTKTAERNPVQGDRVKAGNRQGTNFVYNKVVDPKTQMENYGLMYDGDKDAKYFIKQQYKDLFDQYPEEQAKALAIQDLASKRPIQTSRNQLVMDVKEDNWKEKALFNEMLRRSRGGDSGGGEEPIDLEIPFGSPKNGGVVQAKGFVKVPMANKNFAGSEGIDMYTGQPKKLTESSNRYNVVGVGNFDVASKDLRDNNGKIIKRGSLVQGNFASKNPGMVTKKPMIQVRLGNDEDAENILIPYDRMPQNLTKKDKQILGSFKPSSGSQSRPTSTKFKNVPKGGF